MDELALLKGFRVEDGAPNGAREHARAALLAALARQRRARRRASFLVAFVGALILAGAAYAVARELIVGDPAPEEVRQQPARFGHSAELIPVPHPDHPQLEHARVAAVLDSSVGRVYLFASPNATGLCVNAWIEGDRGYQGRLNMSGVCGPSEQSFFAFSNQVYEGKTVRLFFGRAGEGVSRVALRFGSRTVDVPLTGRRFLAEFPEQPDEFLSFGPGGRVLEQREFMWQGPRPSQIVKPPHQVTRAREVARIRARNGSEQVTLFVGRASDGGYCRIVRSDRRRSTRGCSVSRPDDRELGVDAMNFGGGAPGGILLLVGPVGAKVAALDLVYEDGRTASVPLHDGWALYEIDPADYAPGRRPELLVGRDASGRETGTVRLPWAGP